MIVIDSSALIAILDYEPERKRFFKIIAEADRRVLSAVIYQESAQVMFSRHGQQGIRALDEFLDAVGAEVVPHDKKMAQGAVAAFSTYGKGINSKARLNLCDCASYALAKAFDAPLLFKGNDFSATDVATPE